MKRRIDGGILITNGVVLERHELDTVMFFVERGEVVELIRPSNKNGARTADFWMDGLAWEMKSPRGKGKYLMRDTIERALEQSSNIVMDLRRTSLPTVKCVRELMKYGENKKVARLKIIVNRKGLIN